MRLSTYSSLPVLWGVFTTPAHASWHAILPRQTEAIPTPTPTENFEAVENCLFTSSSILRSYPTEPPVLRPYGESAASEGANEALSMRTPRDSRGELDHTSVCSLYLGIPTRELTMLPSELSTVFSTYREARSSWIAQAKPQLSEFSERCLEVLGTKTVVDYLQEFATGLEECLTNMELLFGTFVPTTPTDNGGIVWTGDWERVSTPVTTTSRSSTAAGARETAYMVPVLGVVGAAAWAGAAMV
ncbi:hypothetical protein QC761_0082410 [Podospora bellae-mahoneyi]|uniref:Uncharacterized protein n=1 Tax=Podospora bellae-mahoneyi TaxID=2093777 RepID=A0ABR0FGK7_9PEZI|nr:hypothetical protein QC761_0082410 [Podospora bellae-mahoneyi]